jgi:enterobactin synthetase component D
VVSYSVAFRIELDHGHCVGVHLPPRDPSLPEPAREHLHAAELARADDFGARRKISWLGGRIALRLALSDVGAAAPDALLSDDRGAPMLPVGWVGSVSHKDRLAVALIAPRSHWAIGVDIEGVREKTQDIGRQILTDRERAVLDALDATTRQHELLFRFSAKEALYKALDPYVRRFVGFKEVEVERDDAGQAHFRLGLAQGEGPFVAEGSWRLRDDYFLTTARVRTS